MKSSIRFSPRMNRWFYGLWGILFFSGVVWLVSRYLLVSPDEFEGQQDWLEPSLMRLHGAAAMAVLILLGAMIPSHMRRAWEKQRNRLTAIGMIFICSLLILTGYGLYYSGNEELRVVLSSFHGIAGCLFPLLLIWHIFIGRKERDKNK